uniref:SNF2 N-terminal domain-containing protein n=1 Tax=Triticum urartu TaxID=4572 RepID=A0A8R7UKJ7_TRIUA
MVGYTRFSWIIDSDGGAPLQLHAGWDMLLMFRNLLIMDEGHTAQNESTNVLESLRRVHTPLVLSDTLSQNHVAEVFNILNL